MKKELFYILLMPAIVIGGCKKDIVENELYGPLVEVGSGHVRSFVNINRDGVPQELGVVMTAGALQNLPQAPAGTTGEYPINYTLELHHRAKEVTPYHHIDFVWQPAGHPSPPTAPGAFSPPHFDLHFYMISMQEQMAIPAFIPPGQPNSNATMFAAPPAGYLPSDYTIAAAPVAQMGRHWIDAASSILPPTLAPFTHEMIYGTFAGKVVFLEPMINRTFLLAVLAGTQPAVHSAIKQPTIFNPTGTYYPTRFNIYTDEKKGGLIISLDQFVLR